MNVAGKNARRRRLREVSNRERVLAFLRALFRRPEEGEIAVSPDPPPTASAAVTAVPLGPRPSAGSAEAVADDGDA